MSDSVGREFTFDVEAELEMVWDALTTPDGLASWYVSAAEVEPNQDGQLRLDWGTGLFGMGSFAVYDRPHRLKLVYNTPEVGAEEWLLTHSQGTTQVRLIHSLPVEDDATWDDTYPDIVNGWALFFGTLVWVGRTQNRLGRSLEVHVGNYTDGGWDRVLAVLEQNSTPAVGATIALPGDLSAEVLVSVDGSSLLLAVANDATLLVDVEGDALYTLSATYGDDSELAASEERATLRAAIVSAAEQLCAAAG